MSRAVISGLGARSSQRLGGISSSSISGYYVKINNYYIFYSIKSKRF